MIHKYKLNGYNIVLDVNSGAETDGFKDREKIFACVAAARQKEEYN